MAKASLFAVEPNSLTCGNVAADDVIKQVPILLHARGRW
jgi:hypothetical protein